MDFYFHYRDPNLHSSSVVTTSNKTFHGRSSSSSSHVAAGDQKKTIRNHKRNNNGLLQNAKVKLSTDPQSVAARERRHRISDKLKILRSMIPGGDTKNMDTVSMLEEAIQYVKLLKSQIWLHQTTFISFENYNDDQYYWPHQADLFTFDHGDYYHHHDQLSSSLPKMERFSEGSSCFKDNIGSLYHDSSSSTCDVSLNF